MKTTIFKKYLLTSTCIILVSFFFLGIMLWFSFLAYWKQEKRELLTENARAISRLIQTRAIKKGDSLYFFDSSVLQNFISNFAININAEIFVVNLDGEKIFCSEEKNCKHENKSVPQDIIQKALVNKYEDTTKLGDIYEDTQYVVGLPIKSQQGTGFSNIGVVFTAINAQNLYNFRTDIISIFILSLIIAFIVSFLAMGFLSYRMTKPLRQMSLAAKFFGEGDFSTRINLQTKDELNDLAKSLNSMAESLESLEKMRKSFVTNVSHELRTPMTTISGFIQGILDGTIPEDRQKHYLSIVSEETQRLSRLVTSMLELSRIDSKSNILHKEITDISKIIKEVLMSLEEKINSKNLKIFINEKTKSIFTKCDVDMIHQVIYNILENAIKFSNDDGYIKILIEVKNNFASVSISNTGCGIKDDEIKFVFERFYKTDKSRSKDRNGLGIGLYLASKIVKLHGGKIEVESIENKETTFTFTLPIDN